MASLRTFCINLKISLKDSACVCVCATTWRMRNAKGGVYLRVVVMAGEGSQTVSQAGSFSFSLAPAWLQLQLWLKACTAVKYATRFVSCVDSARECRTTTTIARQQQQTRENLYLN